MIETLFPEGVHTGSLAEEVDPALLYPEEANCIRSAVPARRREFAQGRLCARRVLAELGIRDFPLLKGEDRAPIWPEGIVGSLTHSAGYCAAAVARAEGFSSLGIDVETAEPLAAELASLVCLESELARLRELSEASRGIVAKLLFSAKETVFKSVYPVTRVFLEFHDCEIGLDEDRGMFTAVLRNPRLPLSGRGTVLRGRCARDPDRLFTGIALPSRT
jgi:4'-phosphopantetheinyl transferase EntD